MSKMIKPKTQVSTRRQKVRLVEERPYKTGFVVLGDFSFTSQAGKYYRQYSVGFRKPGQKVHWLWFFTTLGNQDPYLLALEVLKNPDGYIQKMGYKTLRIW